MSKERPFEDITPVPNIKVGYHEKEAYLEIIDRQAKQIDNFSYTIMALQSRIELLEKRQRPQGEWIKGTQGYFCSECDYYDSWYFEHNFCPNCGSDMRGGRE